MGGSLWIREYGSKDHRAMLPDWPMPRPRKWIEQVNQPANQAELGAVRRSCQRGESYASTDWVKKTEKNSWDWSRPYGGLEGQISYDYSRCAVATKTGANDRCGHEIAPDKTRHSRIETPKAAFGNARAHPVPNTIGTGPVKLLTSNRVQQSRRDDGDHRFVWQL